MAVTATSQLVETMYPRDGQFLVLTKLAATPWAAVDDVRISISRDTDANHITDLKTYSVGLDRELSMFIPAMSELSLNIVSSVDQTVSLRYTILKCRLSNLLRARFGLASKDELPGDVFDKVAVGLL
ncbi:unnamed protein product [marine sediment metagenome]|uniref:Uncharacterized protein n=1 Tax=marine sediment metagenome TaxID=412755 RepID=X1TZS2_9ZZZZ